MVKERRVIEGQSQSIPILILDERGQNVCLIQILWVQLKPLMTYLSDSEIDNPKSIVFLFLILVSMA